MNEVSNDLALNLFISDKKLNPNINNQFSRLIASDTRGQNSVLFYYYEYDQKEKKYEIVSRFRNRDRTGKWSKSVWTTRLSMLKNGQPIYNFPAIRKIEHDHSKNKSVWIAPIVYICEGESDTLSLIGAGYYAIGLPGVNGMNDYYIKYINNLFSAGVICPLLMFDNDEAGIGATEKLAIKLNCKTIDWAKLLKDFPKLDGCRDINDILRTCPDQFNSIVESITKNSIKPTIDLKQQNIKELLSTGHYTWINQPNGYKVNPCPLCGHNDCFDVSSDYEKYHCFSCNNEGNNTTLAKALGKPFKQQSRMQSTKQANSKKIEDPEIEGEFFSYNKKSNTYSIVRYKLFSFLYRAGFCKYKKSNGDYEIIRIRDNIIEEVNITDISDFVRYYIQNNIKNEDLLELMLKGYRQYLAEDSMRFLETVKPEFHNDTATQMFFYFLNCFVEVNPIDVLVKDYKELKGYIWKKEVIKKNFAIDICPNIPYENLLVNISGEDIERYKQLLYAQAYACHRYKDPTKTRAIIFVDECPSQLIEGRTGKSLIGKTLQYLRNVVRIEGKNFDFNKNFLWQDVSCDTDIIFLDDVKSNFDLERMFNVITDGIHIEKKHKNPIFIPYENSPKVLITTNKSLKGEGASFYARKLEVPFSDYYSDVFTPEEDIKVGRLFEGYTQSDWNRFYTFMFYSFKLYLAEPNIKSILTDKYKNKKIVENTCLEFFQFAEELTTGTVFIKKDVFEEFLKNYEGNQKYLKLNTFSKWLNTYAIYKSWRYKSWRSNGITRFIYEENTQNSPKQTKLEKESD